MTPAKPKPAELARDAGRAAYLTEPPDRRHPDACPFEPGTDERAAWLEGFEEALDEATHPDELRKALKEANR